MVWWLFARKRGLDELKESVDDSLSAVKDDVKKAAEWINHLHSKGKNHDFALDNINERISNLENNVDEIKTFISFFGSKMGKQVFKQQQTLFNKQTAVEGVQTPVQTVVQTAFLGNLSSSERVVVWVLLNTDMKLSCEDISSVLNKDRSTVRGQLNNIKQKSENLIKEYTEKTGKKRYYISEETKEMMLKTVRVSEGKKKQKKVNSESY